jgi:starch-binding outer membrane protein, SusD/RagB family
MNIKQLALAVGIVGSLALTSCSLDIPDLNNPGLEQLENAPTAASINTATTGLLIGDRGGKSATVGLVNLLGILGRESYDFDSADIRFVSEMIQGNLSKASPFGGSFWTGQYSNIRLGNIVLHGVDKVAEFTDAQKSGIKGFAHTLQAMELITVMITHDTTGAVIDTDHPLGDPLGAFVPKDEVYAEIARLLDQSQTELAAAGTAFTFALSPGYNGFNTPPNFIKFNRALKAKISVYQKQYQAALDALAQSFLKDKDDDAGAVSFTVGTSHSYSLASGDQTNALINAAIFAHPALETDAQKQADGTTLDARYLAKVEKNIVEDDDGNKTVKTVTSGADTALKTNIKFKIYTNVSAVPVIRNEELILLKAEALWFTGNKTGAMEELNLVRTRSGKLAALAEPADDTAFVDALLYERRYSLMFEGGHRWIDLRRFGRPIPVDAPAHVRNLRFPVPQAECDARVNEPACAITSSDP